MVSRRSLESRRRVRQREPRGEPAHVLETAPRACQSAASAQRMALRACGGIEAAHDFGQGAHELVERTRTRRGSVAGIVLVQ